MRRLLKQAILLHVEGDTEEHFMDRIREWETASQGWGSRRGELGVLSVFFTVTQ